MSGWLSKEILDHLAHAGYVAVPKERIETFWTEVPADRYELMNNPEHGRAISEAIARRLATEIAHCLLRQGFLDIEQSMVDGDYAIRHRACLHALKPRTIKPEEPHAKQI